MSAENAALARLDQATGSHAGEVRAGQRFEFGKNWERFLSLLNEERISRAETSLRTMLEVEKLDGRRFLDIGSGSGLFSLAARRLGAEVHSFDFDPKSVGCTAELRRRYSDGSPQWRIEEGSALDESYVRSLGQFDVVYSWGVLHHTGSMWQGLHNASLAVAPGGKLFIAIYNDTGSQAARWKWIKKTYNRLPGWLRLPFTVAVISPQETKSVVYSIVTGRFGAWLRSWNGSSTERGMSRWRDIVDWVGGYPYEVATPEEIFEFFKARGFSLSRLKCGGVGLGCNEFVFVRERAAVG